MPSPIYPVIIPSSLDVEDALSFTYILNLTLVSSNYFPVTPGNIPPNSLKDPRNSIDSLASLSFSPFPH